MGYIKVAPGESLESVVNRLLEAKANGEDAYTDFGQHYLNADFITMDSAYMKVYGMDKETFDEVHKEMAERKAEEAQKEKEREEKLRNENSRNGKPITDEEVINGLKFIAENQSLSQEDLFYGLIDIGCNFTVEDVRKQFPNVDDISIFDGLKDGVISTGAAIIVNMRKNKDNREIGTEKFLSTDDDGSIYHFIRVASNDPSYTKEYAERLGRGAKK